VRELARPAFALQEQRVSARLVSASLAVLLERWPPDGAQRAPVLAAEQRVPLLAAGDTAARARSHA